MAINKRLIAGAPTGGGGACTTDTLQILGDTSCIAYYKMADATDESGSYSGTSSNVDFNIEGKYGLAGKFNGSTSCYMDLPSSLAPTIRSAAAFSVSLWFKRNGNQTNTYGGRLIQILDNIYININLQTNNTVKAIVSTSSLAAPETVTGVVPDNTWNHIVFAGDSNGIKLYLNGSLADSDNWDGTFMTYTDANYKFNRIGFSGSDVAYFKGKIDQVRIFNKAISATEVGTLYAEVQCATAVTPSEHFNTVLWTNGVGQHQSPITGVGFQPDFVWIKSRTSGTNHVLTDSVRGATKTLESNTTDNEETVAQGLTAFNADGFALGNDDRFNPDQRNNVAWNWYAPTSESISASGSRMASTVKKNVDAGFSIASYTGNGNGNQEVGHGLTGGVDLVIIKNRSQGDDFAVFSTGLDDNKFLELARNYAQSSNAGLTHSFNSTTIGLTSSSPHDMVNESGENYIMWSFKSVEGYSRIGSYVGTASDSGNFVVTGFEVAFLLVKRIDANADWFIFDNKRKFGDTSLTNPFDGELRPNRSLEEDNFDAFNFTTNGFELANSGTNMNASGGKYLFMAFANDPDTSAPTKADSFEAKTYTGNGGTQNIAMSNGMKPDFVWLKERSGTQWHSLYDSIRGVGNRIVSNSTNAENFDANRLTGFNDGNFSIGSDGDTNTLNDTYISWNWKAADHDRNLATINQDGSITSLVSANPAAGFSIVKTGTSNSIETVGHGLGLVPKLIISKPLDVTIEWIVWTEGFTNLQGLILNSLAAKFTNGSFKTVTSVSSTTIGLGRQMLSSNDYGGASGEIIHYIFADVAGYQKIGSYTWTGTSYTAGTLVTGLGFTPRFVMIKGTDVTSNWMIYDNQRVSGTQKYRLAANIEDAEDQVGYQGIIFDSDGFSAGTGADGNVTGSDGLNKNGSTYIYLAIA